MPTCECGYKESGRYFKGKVCPECGKKQFPQTFSLPKKEPSKKKSVLFANDSFVKQEKEAIIEIPENSNFNGLLTKPTVTQTPIDEPYSIPQLEPDLEKLDSVSINKIILSAKEWELLTLEVYGVAHEMLRDLNPEYYDSKTAQKLRDLNAKLASIVLSSKEVNPVRILLFTNLLYCLPALKGLVPKRKRKTDKEEKEPDKPKRKTKETQPNSKFYDE